MQYATLNFYLSLIGFSVFMMVLGLCVPFFESFVKFLEDKGHAGEDPTQVKHKA